VSIAHRRYPASTNGKHSVTTPCTANPDAWIQPAENPNWDQLTTTKFAQKQCRNACPAAAFRQCAIDALTAGNLEDEPKRVRSADGVIAAGIVCRGDLATTHQLMLIIDPNADLTVTSTDGEACSTCERVFIPDDETVVLGTNTAHRATIHLPLCRGCYTAARRADTLTPAVKPIIPAACVTCKRPMTTRANKVAGSVVHHSAGNCDSCAKRAKRMAGRQDVAA
jgi:hypothetical protein